MSPTIHIQEVEFGSPAQQETVDLRYKVLREPLGLTFDPADLAKENADHHIALYLDGKLAAVLLLKPLNSGETIKMRQVAVHPDHQGRGLGRMLVRFSEEFAKNMGFRTMELHARETAVPFYLALQYSVTGEPFTEVGIPHRKMYRTL